MLVCQVCAPKHAMKLKVFDSEAQYDYHYLSLLSSLWPLVIFTHA